MSIPHSTSTAGTGRPSRRVQAVIWALFAVAVVVGFSTSTYAQSAGAVAPTTAATATSAAGQTGDSADQSGVLTIAAEAPGADNRLLRDRFATDPDGLLPAYRWANAMYLPNDYGVTDQLAIGGDDMASNFAILMFSFASWTWWLLLTIVKFAVGMDLVTNAAAEIDGSFRTAALALGKTGLPLLAIVFAILLAAGRILRGKMNQSISLILGAALVVGGLSFFTAASKGGVQTFHVSGETIKATSVGSPAYIAQRGNAFVNTIVGQVVTGFGATNSVTKKVRNGEFSVKGDTDGATCNFYVRQLYATYNNYSGAAEGSAAGLAANAQSMVSFMWQRALYDNWTMAAFGTLGDGARISCHQLERVAGIDPVMQFAVVGGVGEDGTAKHGPYKGMRFGPFFAEGLSDDDHRAQRLSWAACGGSTGKKARAGWDTAGRVTDEACADWWSWVPEDKWIGTKVLEKIPGNDTEVGINSGDSEYALKWSNMGQFKAATTWDGVGSQSEGAALAEVQAVVRAYYGENGGQRLFAGLMSLIAAALYAWAFAAAALGVIFTQIGLLFFLCLLPYTLLMLAFPTKDGGRNKAGARMLKMTGAFLGGKAVFLALLGATVQLMSILFTVVGSFSGGSGTSAAGGRLVLAAGSNGGGMHMLWALVVPAATIFVVRMVTKGLGLGDLMSLSGAAGFATSAVLSGKDNKKARSQFQGGLKGSLLGKTLDRADRGVKRGATAPGRAVKNRIAKEHKGAKLAKALRDGKITQQQFSQISKGKSTLAQALAANKVGKKAPELSPDLRRAVTSGQMTLGQAKAVARAQAKSKAETEATAAETPQIGGFAGAQERLGAFGKDTSGAGPMFVSKLGATADRDQLRTAQTERRTALAVKNKGVDEAAWEANALEGTLSTFEAIRATAQQSEFGVSLTPGQIAEAKVELAKTTGIPEDMILLGSSGLPPLIAPLPRDAVTGQLQFPNDISAEAKVALALNPLNYSDLSQKIGESIDQFHMRAALDLHAAGVMDDLGNFANLLAAEGIDLATKAGREQLQLAIDGKSSSLRLEDIKLTVPDAERRIIDTVVREHYPSSQFNDVLVNREQADSVAELASSARRQAEAVRVELAQTVNHVLDRQGTDEFGREMDKVLRSIEDRIPALATDLGAVALEARLTDDWVAGALGDPGKLRSQAKAMSEAGENAIRDLARELTNAVAEIKLTSDPGQQADLLKELHRNVQETMSSAATDMSSNVEKMLQRATDEARTREQQLASQLHAPVRARDFSGGARDLT